MEHELRKPSAVIREEKRRVEIANIEKDMAKPEVFENPDTLAEKTEKHTQLKQQLESKQENWETIYLEIEELEAS